MKKNNILFYKILKIKTNLFLFHFNVCLITIKKILPFNTLSIAALGCSQC